MSVYLDNFVVVKRPGVGGDMAMRLQIVNNKDSPIPADARLSFAGNKLFKPLDQRIPAAVEPRGELPTRMSMVRLAQCMTFERFFFNLELTTSPICNHSGDQAGGQVLGDCRGRC